MGIEGAGKPPSTHHRQLPQVVEDEEGEVEVDREEEAEVEGAVVAQKCQAKGVQEIRRCAAHTQILWEGGWGCKGVGWWFLCFLCCVYLLRVFRVALLTNDSNLERCQRYANLLPEM